ncbi:MAG: PQQ-dependent sugar dehydrogenase [Planctomycetes bacterium]|nr:PQQ-dependent sugar dehydrogenase [Planctomycetota bacterium]
MSKPLVGGVIAGAVIALLATTSRAADAPAPTAPRVVDDRLEVICFAASPDIVHPVSIDFDARGRLLVIESHTHFRPPDYQGPAHDRIRILEDTDGDGRADKFTTFYEGSDATMDLATARDGSVYVAARSEIFRLRDLDGDGAAESKQTIIKLNTAGNYPHNGLSGLTFDAEGNLWFGMGENLGASYELVAADGSTIKDQGEGGNVFRCTAAGAKLQRVATGFWNPFGLTIDVFGRVWCVDNDPDSSPPCRLLHVIDGGDYGYQFRYGRSGRHPFQSWNGQLPGTLPMVSGTGEAPCEVLSYESDGLPDEYRGDLLVTSWADHRVERYRLQPRGASYVAERKPFVQGGTEFRPVGLATAPDGSLYFSDWVRRDYNLHHQGAVWHLRQVGAKPQPRPEKLEDRLQSHDRSMREQAARELVATKDGHELLATLSRKPGRDQKQQLRVLATIADTCIEPCDALLLLMNIETDVPFRAHVVEIALRNKLKLWNADWLNAKQPAAVRLAAISAIATPEQLLTLLDDDDPFLRTAAVRELGHNRERLAAIRPDDLKTPRQRIGLLLAQRAAGMNDPKIVADWLADSDEAVRFLAAKWIADRQLTELRPQVASALEGPGLSVRLYQGLATALARLDGEEVSDAKMADHFVKLLNDSNQPAARRATLLRLVPATHKQLSLDLLKRLANQSDVPLQLEAVRSLAEHPSEKRLALLTEILNDTSRDEQVRAEALVGLTSAPTADVPALVQFALGSSKLLRDEALRALTSAQLSAEQQSRLQQLATQQPDSAELVARALGKSPDQARPDVRDTAGWLLRLDGPASAEAGRRAFFNARLAGCNRCHRVEGHGQSVGPDLSLIGSTERRHILESILQPSAIVAPHYQVWQMVLDNGQVASGMLIHTNLDEYTYLDAQGKQFKVRTTEVSDIQPQPESIMPVKLIDRFTDQELRDLLAFLTAHR